MEFQPAPPKVPVAIPEIQVTLKETPEGSEVRYRFVIRYDDHSTESRAGNLAPHLTPQQISELQALMTALRAQAEAQILPQGG